MDLNIIIACIAALSLAGIAFIMRQMTLMKTELKFLKTQTADHSSLQLQAYERLTLFADRSSLNNIVGRIVSPQDTVRSLQTQISEEIRSEYEYNVPQQIYVAPQVWDAVTRLKDQQIYTVNQLAMMLPMDAPASELKSRIVEFAMNENADLSPIVLNAIQFEAKKII